MSGYPGTLTASQASKLEKLKENAQDIWLPKFDDFYMCRWLRAREWDVKKAEKMLRDTMEWRKKNGIDTILEDWEPPEVLVKYSPGGFTGFDKKGGPIWIDC